MKRIVFSTLGILELLVAGVLVVLAWLAGRTDVPMAFAKAEKVTRQASHQVRLVHQQVQNIHGPELRELAIRLQAQTLMFTTTLQSQQLDFDTVGTLADAMEDLANGLVSLSNSFQADQIGKVGEALEEAAQFLETIIPAAAKVAGDLEKAPGGQNNALTQALRETGKLKEVAGSLRQARTGIGSMGARWPEFCASLTKAASLLKTSRKQLQTMVKNRTQYETARNQAVLLGESFSQMVPLFSDQIEGLLREQDRNLVELGQSMDEIGDILPPNGHAMDRLLRVAQLLAWLVAGTVSLHGLYLILSVRIGGAFSV
ncbi:MAG TPA: hypothetical protein VGY77_03385 [Gemmataceae bacterium]|nr:hypothetical protein [Gemmataceae bacterium]